MRRGRYFKGRRRRYRGRRSIMLRPRRRAGRAGYRF